jgi:hypothetical protein
MHLVCYILFGIRVFSDYMFLAGRSGAGKSFLLLQAVEYCAQSDWVVIYIPRGVSICIVTHVDAHINVQLSILLTRRQDIHMTLGRKRTFNLNSPIKLSNARFRSIMVYCHPYAPSKSTPSKNESFPAAHP